MKHINEYIDDKIINEGLISWLKAFIKKIRKNQEKLIDSTGRVNMLDMDTSKLKFQKEPAKLLDLSKDKYTVEIWSNPKIGFTQSAEIIKNMRKYCVDVGDEKSEPYVYTFYYKTNDTYYAAVIIYEKNIQYITNYLHILSIETNKVVDNPTDVQKSIFELFKKEMANRNKSIVGFTGKDTTKRNVILGALKNVGFKQSDDENFDDLYILEK